MTSHMTSTAWIKTVQRNGGQICEKREYSGKVDRSVTTLNEETGLVEPLRPMKSYICVCCKEWRSETSHMTRLTRNSKRDCGGDV